MSRSKFEDMLTGGHPNSLGNTLQVVDEILHDQSKLAMLLDCYKSDDEVVRLRVSNAMKRICKEHPDWVAAYLDELLGSVSKIDQPSTKWTLATLFMLLDSYMSDVQRTKAIQIMRHNLQTEKDWIVQNTTAESLAYFAAQDQDLRVWLIPELQKQTADKHKSVARRAEKLLAKLG